MRIAKLAGPTLVLTLTLALSGCQRAEQDIAPVETSDDSGDIAAQPTTAPQGRFAPRNDCIGLPGAKQFFLTLENAVKNRDAEALLGITDAKVKLDFGGGAGLQTFRERLADPQGRLWPDLAKISALGCAHATNGDMVMPSFADQQMDDVDVAKALIVTGRDVPVRQTAAAAAPAVDTVSWDAVSLIGGFDPEAPFQHVTTAGGKDGYIASDHLRSPLDYRLRASHVGNGWRIVSFVNGD